jgi:hypothetical protein
MYLAADYIHPTPHKGRCRVRIYRPDLPEEGSAARDEAVVICSELKDNPGMSITNASERNAGEVISFHQLPPAAHPPDLGRALRGRRARHARGPAHLRPGDVLKLRGRGPGRVPGRGAQAHRRALLEAPGPSHGGGAGRESLDEG